MKVTEKEYRADPRLAQSTIKIFAGEEEDYSREQSLHQLSVPFKATADMNKGSLIHSIMEHERNFDRDRFAIAPCNDKRKKEYRDFAKECDAEIIMTASDLTDCRNMYDRFCLEHPDIYAKLKAGEKEKAFFTEEFKCLVDLDFENEIYDWKKTSDITIRGLRKSCNKYGYDIQAYHYNMVTGKEFTFVFFQDTAPYEIVVYKCESEFIQRGKAKWNQAYDRYCNRNVVQPREISMLWDSEKI